MTTTDRPRTWILLVLSGLILGLAYPPNPVGLFGSVGLVPLLYALERARSVRQVIAWSYGSLVIFSALTSWWVGSWQAKADPFLMISCVLLVIAHPFFFIVPLVIYYLVRRAKGSLFALMMLPFLWCGGEYLHALSDASYPWLTLGNTQTYNLYFLQFIEFTGIWGASFLLLVQNCAITAILLALGYPEQYQRRLVRICASIIALTLIPAYIYGFYVLGTAEPAPREKTITVTVVQPNENPWDKWKAIDTTNHITVNSDLSLRSLDNGRPDLFLWAENAIPYTITQPGNEYRKQQMQEAVDRLGVPVMTGFPDYLEYERDEDASPSSKHTVRQLPDGRLDTVYYDHFNAVGLFLPGTGFAASYHKMQLVPFGERIPFADEVPFLISMLSWDVGISSWGKGKKITVFDVPLRGTTTKAASAICFESIYPGLVRKFVEAGANVLTIVSNDGWYLHTPGPLQDQRFALLRAIENRRAIARAANTGISCFIDPYGRIISETPEDVSMTATGTIELRDDVTIYTSWGDWWPQLCLAVAVAMIAMAMVTRSRGTLPRR